jgi:glucose/mannose transport system substrate-binding protein
MKKLLSLVLVLSVMLGATSLALAQGPSGELEIFSWWAGDEGPALEALIARYSELNPDVEVINATVTGGSGVNAKAVLKTRMLGGDPPDAFQVHAGQELIGTWVVADRMEDLTPLFEEQGWMEAFPRGCSTDQHRRASGRVPVTSIARTCCGSSPASSRNGVWKSRPPGLTSWRSARP